MSNLFNDYLIIKDNFLRDLNFKQISFENLYLENVSKLDCLVFYKIFGISKENLELIDEYHKLLSLFNSYNVDINGFYYDILNEDSNYIRIFYVHNGYILDIHEQKDVLSLLELIKETILEFDSYFISNKKQPFLFHKLSAIHGPSSINFLYKYINKNDLNTIVKSIQKFNDYNSNNICLEAIKMAYKDTLSSIDNISPNEYIIAYRGQGSKSKSYLEAYSWTLNKDVALFFATRAFASEVDKNKMKLYKAEIPKDSVIGVINDEEQEILVNPGCLNNIYVEEVDFDKTKQYSMPKLENKSVSVYKSENFDDNESICISPKLLELFSQNK